MVDWYGCAGGVQSDKLQSRGGEERMLGAEHYLAVSLDKCVPFLKNRRVRSEGGNDELLLTIRKTGFAFSTSCVEALNNTEYVSLMQVPDTALLVLRPCGMKAKGRLRLYDPKRKNKSRVRYSVPEWTSHVYELMGWEKECGYRVSGGVHLVEKALVFDLGQGVMIEPKN